MSTTSYLYWDFQRLPESEHDAAIKAVRSRDFDALRRLHDKYQLSPYSYCCNADGLLVWFNYAIESGKIKPSSASKDVGDAEKR